MLVRLLPSLARFLAVIWNSLAAACNLAIKSTVNDILCERLETS